MYEVNPTELLEHSGFILYWKSSGDQHRYLSINFILLQLVIFVSAASKA